MVGMSQRAIASGRLAKTGGFAFKFAPLWELFGRAFETEVALRRPFLWLPVAAGTGVVLYLYADREPSLWLIAPAAISFSVLAYLARAKRLAFYFLCGLCAVSPANCRLPCGRRGSRRRSSTRSGSSRCTVLSKRWTFAAMARAFFCGFILPKGLRRNKHPTVFAFPCAGRRHSRPEPM